MNPGIRELPTKLAPMPLGFLGAPTAIPMPYHNRYWHPEAIDWLERVRRNGGNASSTTLAAISDFCVAAEVGLFRSAIFRLNLVAGNSLSSALVPLFRGPVPGGRTFGFPTDVAFNFVSQDFVETGRSGGLKGRATNKALDTGLTPNELGGFLNIHLSGSGTELETGTTVQAGTTIKSWFLLSFFQGASSAATLMIRDDSGTGRHAYSGNYSTVFKTSTTVEPHMFFQRTSANVSQLYSSGGLASSNGTTAFSVSSNTPFSAFVTSGICRQYSIGRGMTSAQIAAFSAAVIAFNNALGR